MSARVGDYVVYRSDDTNLTVQVTHVHDDETIDIVVHDDAGQIMGGIVGVKLAKTDHAKKTDRHWWPKANPTVKG